MWCAQVIIENFEDLATGRRRRDCLGILEAGLRAADPGRAVRSAVTTGGIRAAGGGGTVRTGGYSGVYSVAFGKAADSMTRALNAVIPVAGGIVVIPRGSRSAVRGKKFQVFNSGHPVPDQASVKAARDIVKFLGNRRGGELVVFLVSGGGSALLAMPDGITLDEKVRVTDLLLRSGAPIGEINCVRKHLSRIKGGRLVDGVGCDWVSLIMSDVQGDDPSSVASGPTCADATTYADALRVIEGRGLERKMPARAMEVLRDGARGEAPRGEAPRGGGAGVVGAGADGGRAPARADPRNVVIAGNDDCLAAMRERAAAMGYAVTVMRTFGDIKDATREIVGRVESAAGVGDGAAPRKGWCIVFGGETTVKVLSRRGMGGRSQELVLRILKNVQRMDGRSRRGMVIASMGTDGIDGNSPFAGAIADGTGEEDAGAIKEALRTSDSGRFFQRRGGSIRTGHTHTNLMDIGVILV